LRGADLTGADLESATLTAAKLEGAAVRGTLLDSACRFKPVSASSREDNPKYSERAIASLSAVS
jgi:uncharacterized protein YjbI with pentapeptide repeats